MNSSNETAKFERNGQYKIIEKIGEGTVCEVFLAIENETSREVVMKISKFETEQKRMKHNEEVSVLNSLQFNNEIIKLYNYYTIEDSDISYYDVVVMEKMDSDLMEYILHHERIGEAECKFIFRRICETIQNCHSNQIFHCNLKPENILIRWDQNRKLAGIKLTDFEIANSLPSIDPQLIFSNSPYLPFEFHGNPFDHPILPERIDIFSLGVMLYLMLTGTLPFLFRGKVAMKNDLKLVNRYCKNEDCLLLLERLLKEDPNDRPSVQDILDHPWLSLPKKKRTSGSFLRILKKKFC